MFQSNKYDHITPLLKERHWLPNQQGIEFKILLIRFKALNYQDLFNRYPYVLYNFNFGGWSFALASDVVVELPSKLNSQNF